MAPWLHGLGKTLIDSLGQPCCLEFVSITKLEFSFLLESLYHFNHLALRPILHIGISAEMVRLDFSFDCKVFAFNFRVGSKPCACNIRPNAQIATSARHDWANDATQISDPIILTSSKFLDSKKDKTSGLPPAKSSLDSVIDPLLLKSSRSSDTTNRKPQGLVTPKNLSGSQIIINAGEYLSTKSSQSPPESTANICAHKDTGNSSNDTVQGGVIAWTRGSFELLLRYWKQSSESFS